MPVHAVSGARACSTRANPCASPVTGSASGDPALHAAQHRFQIGGAHRLFGQGLEHGLTHRDADLAAKERVQGEVFTGLVAQLAPDLFVEYFAESRAIEQHIGQSPLLGLVVEAS